MDNGNSKKVLDTTCGGRMMWFDKKNPLAFFIDERHVDPRMVGKGRNARLFGVEPDAVMDHRHMEFPDETFYLTVFDPPHLKNNAAGYMSIKYGKLPKDWQTYLNEAFAECWRVTKTNGTIVFKWNESEIATSKVIEAIGQQPLFGHTTNNKGTTKWMCFLKTEQVA